MLSVLSANRSGGATVQLLVRSDVNSAIPRQRLLALT